jgi:hypothetical protein
MHDNWQINKQARKTIYLVYKIIHATI